MSNQPDPLWDSLKGEAWIRGNLTYKLHKTQQIINQTFKSSQGQLFVANCSRQLGKSYWAVCKAIETAIKIPNAQIRYGAAFHSDLVTFIIPAFNKVLEDAPVQVMPTYKTSGSYFVFPNGSKIKLVGLDKNPDGLRGATLDLVILDECGFVTELDYLYKSIIIPATTHRPNARIVMISTPPSTPAHPFMEYCHKADEAGAYAKFDIFTNPLIDEATINRLMEESGGAESTTWRREYLCEFITDSDSAVVPEWDDKYIEEYVRDEYFGYYHKYVAMDLGMKDFTAVIFGHYDFKKATLYIEDEITQHGPSMRTNTLVTSLKAKEAELWGEDPVFRRVTDNTWPIMIADMASDHNYHFLYADKDNKEAAINELRILVQSGRIKVHPRCKKTIGCLKYGVWDDKRKTFARSTAYGHFDHLDALIYLVRMTAFNSNPIPAGHGHNHVTSWMGNIKDQQGSHNARTIKDAIIPKPIDPTKGLFTKKKY